MAKNGHNGQSGHNGHGRVRETPDVSHIQNVDVTHESSDVNIGGILKFVVGLTIFGIIVQVLTWGMFRFFNAEEATQEPKQGPMAMTKEERLPPEPRLQVAPGFGVNLSNGQKVDLSLRAPQEEYQVVHKQWEQVLNEGARDQSGNIVGLPIDQAMKKVLEGNGLPSRSQAPGDSDYSAQTPTSASSGRMTEKGRP